MNRVKQQNAGPNVQKARFWLIKALFALFITLKNAKSTDKLVSAKSCYFSSWLLTPGSRLLILNS